MSSNAPPQAPADTPSEPSSTTSTTSTPKPFSISLSKRPLQSRKPSSSSNSTPLPSRPSSSTPGPIPRPPSKSFHAHASDSEPDSDHEPVAEEVTSFDQRAGGAISAREQAERDKGPLVIKVQSGNDWRKRVKGKLVPKEVRAAQEEEQRRRQGGDVVGAGGEVEIDRPSAAGGLSFAVSGEAGKGEKDGEGDVRMANGDGQPGTKKENENETAPLTQDDLAMRALVRESRRGDDDGAPERRRDLVIQSTKLEDEGGYEGGYDESKSFRRDVASRPDSASLSDYSAIPVEEFGAALLRGMGWKDGEEIGRGKYSSTTNTTKKSADGKAPTRRPGYLGIGAKEIPGKGGAETELGAWGAAAMKKAKKPGEGLYMPVLMRNKKTGEMVTTGEFETLVKEGQKGGSGGSGEDEWRERRERNLKKSGREGVREDDRDRERRRRDDREIESDSGRDDRYYRDRDDDRDRRRGRDEKDRRSDRDRDRKHRGSGRSYDEEDEYRSHHSSSTSSRNDRDRDRDRDRERDRRDRYEDGGERRRRSRRDEIY
ncbi:hypothetical protein FQN52_008206 [Onygenales sp. PD_12]|nr:hypothetical protein FQN52_008206 [Onygenales sp. PD_12]